jgi:hypothetical protein
MRKDEQVGADFSVCRLTARGAVVTIPEPGQIVSKIDEMVGPAPEPENAVLTDETRVVRWTGPLFALLSLALLPWTIYIAGSLPAQQVSANYDAAWAGFDVLLAIMLAGTAYFALRRSRYLAPVASATATMLVVDAWFDVLTTPGVQRIESIGLAAFVELPLAAACIWLSWHTQQLEERRIVLLMRRGPRHGVRPNLVASAAAGSPAEPAPSAGGPVP